MLDLAIAFGMGAVIAAAVCSYAAGKLVRRHKEEVVGAYEQGHSDGFDCARLGDD